MRNCWPREQNVSMDSTRLSESEGAEVTGSVIDLIGLQGIKGSLGQDKVEGWLNEKDGSTAAAGGESFAHGMCAPNHRNWLPDCLSDSLPARLNANSCWFSPMRAFA